MEDITKVVGDRIRKYRKEKNLSQEELAHLASLHNTYIGQVERGEKNITIESLFKITRALEVTLADFFINTQSSTTKTLSTEISQIISILDIKSKKDQQFILNIIELLAAWKDNK